MVAFVGEDREWLEKMQQQLEDTPVPRGAFEALTLLNDSELLSPDDFGELMVKVAKFQERLLNGLLTLPVRPGWATEEQDLPELRTYPHGYALMIYAYTLEHPGVYKIWNMWSSSSSRRSNYCLFRKLLPSIKLLQTALHALPEALKLTAGTVYRAQREGFLNPDGESVEAVQRFPANRWFYRYAFQSATKLELESFKAEQFLNKHEPDNAGAIFEVHLTPGGPAFDISIFSEFPAEGEVLFNILSCWRVVRTPSKHSLIMEGVLCSAELIPVEAIAADRCPFCHRVIHHDAPELHYKPGTCPKQQDALGRFADAVQDNDLAAVRELYAAVSWASKSLAHSALRLAAIHNDDDLRQKLLLATGAVEAPGALSEAGHVAQQEARQTLVEVKVGYGDKSVVSACKHFKVGKLAQLLRLSGVFNEDGWSVHAHKKKRYLAHIGLRTQPGTSTEQVRSLVIAKCKAAERALEVQLGRQPTISEINPKNATGPEASASATEGCPPTSTRMQLASPSTTPARQAHTSRLEQRRAQERRPAIEATVADRTSRVRGRSPSRHSWSSSPSAAAADQQLSDTSPHPRTSSTSQEIRIRRGAHATAHHPPASEKAGYAPPSAFWCCAQGSDGPFDVFGALCGRRSRSPSPEVDALQPSLGRGRQESRVTDTEGPMVATECVCGNLLEPNAAFCSRCGKKRQLKCTCGKTLEPDATFCPQCGVQQLVKCRCGTILDSDAAFCTQCGAKRPTEVAPLATACVKCHNMLDSDANFCPQCAMPRKPQVKELFDECVKCGSTFQPAAKFCHKCSTKRHSQADQACVEELPADCVRCGTIFEADAKFCPQCAAPRRLKVRRREVRTVGVAMCQPSTSSCVNCRSPLKFDAKFCPQCATPRHPPVEQLVAHCVNCDSILEFDAKFCTQCAAPRRPKVPNVVSSISTDRIPQAMWSWSSELRPEPRTTNSSPASSGGHEEPQGGAPSASSFRTNSETGWQAACRPEGCEQALLQETVARAHGRSLHPSCGTNFAATAGAAPMQGQAPLSSIGQGLPPGCVLPGMHYTPGPMQPLPQWWQTGPFVMHGPPGVAAATSDGTTGAMS